MGSIFCCIYYNRLTHWLKIEQKTFMGLILEVLGKLSSFGTKLKPLFVNFLDFCLNVFFSFKNAEFWEIFFFNKIFPIIYKNDLKYKLCTILEWDKWQQFAVFIKFLIFWFVLTQSCKTFVSFFLDQTLCLILKHKTFIYSNALNTWKHIFSNATS